MTHEYVVYEEKAADRECAPELVLGYVFASCLGTEGIKEAYQIAFKALGRKDIVVAYISQAHPKEWVVALEKGLLGLSPIP